MRKHTKCLRGFLAYFPPLFYKERKMFKLETADLYSLYLCFLNVGIAGFILTCSHYREDPKGLTRKPEVSCGPAAPPISSLEEEDLKVVQMCSATPEQDTSLMSACTSAAEAQVMTGLDSAAQSQNAPPIVAGWRMNAAPCRWG